MKRIIFIQHAMDRLRERGISTELVIEAIRNPDKIDSENERKIAQKLNDGKLLRVNTKKMKLLLWLVLT